MFSKKTINWMNMATLPQFHSINQTTLMSLQAVINSVLWDFPLGTQAFFERIKGGGNQAPPRSTQVPACWWGPTATFSFLPAGTSEALAMSPAVPWVARLKARGYWWLSWGQLGNWLSPFCALSNNLYCSLDSPSEYLTVCYFNLRQ